MIRKFILWRARKHMRQPRYRLDKRRYRAGTTPGLFAHLDATRFWGTESDPHRRIQRRRRRTFFIIFFVILPGTAWVVYESIRALQWF